MRRFASGYAWLLLNQEGKLTIKTTANQEVPELKREIPLLNVDVWEHSYYLQYQNRRKDYLSAWLRLINWRKVAWRYEEAVEKVKAERMLRGEGWLMTLDDLGGEADPEQVAPKAEPVMNMEFSYAVEPRGESLAGFKSDLG